MRLLAIDTTEDACSAALLVDGEIRELFELAPRRHSELILPMMDGLLDEAGLRLHQLDALAFGRGPGAFTGLRIAASVIQGAAMAADLPVVPVSSLHALAVGAHRRHAAAAVLCALDARMQEVYWGAFTLEDGRMLAAGDEAVCDPHDVPALGDQAWFGAGSGWAAYGPVLAARLRAGARYDADLVAHACDVASIAAGLLEQGQGVPAEQALPTYLRNEVAWKTA